MKKKRTKTELRQLSNEEKHRMLWEFLAKKKFPVDLDAISRKKEAVKQLFGLREVADMIPYEYCYACKEACDRDVIAWSAGKIRTSGCFYCPVFHTPGNMCYRKSSLWGKFKETNGKQEIAEKVLEKGWQHMTEAEIIQAAEEYAKREREAFYKS